MGRELPNDLCQKFVNFCVSEALEYDSLLWVTACNVQADIIGVGGGGGGGGAPAGALIYHLISSFSYTLNCNHTVIFRRN